uniref:RRM domain-containing protein n=1 Tax=Alexandrium monilatum TaxID=311494 RepID=A0A7S4UPU3_9DINO
MEEAPAEAGGAASASAEASGGAAEAGRAGGSAAQAAEAGRADSSAAGAADRPADEAGQAAGAAAEAQMADDPAAVVGTADGAAVAEAGQADGAAAESSGAGAAAAEAGPAKGGAARGDSSSDAGSVAAGSAAAAGDSGSDNEVAAPEGSDTEASESCSSSSSSGAVPQPRTRVQGNAGGACSAAATCGQSTQCNTCHLCWGMMASGWNPWGFPVWQTPPPTQPPTTSELPAAFRKKQQEAQSMAVAGVREPEAIRVGQHSQAPVPLPPMPQNSASPSHEVHVARLPSGGVMSGELAMVFENIFKVLPDFQRLYKPGEYAVDHVQIMGHGTSAFVGFRDEILASTALLMDGLSMRGIALRITRPRCYRIPEGGERMPLDVSPLRFAGLIPPVPAPNELSAYEAHTARPFHRELYVGNLPTGAPNMRSELESLVAYVCQSLPSYDKMLGPPVEDVVMGRQGKDGFVHLQSEALAGEAEVALRSAVLQGCALEVRRPMEYLRLNRKREHSRALASVVDVPSCTFTVEEARAMAANNA